MPDRREELATSFEIGGADYERLRPDYPPTLLPLLVSVDPGQRTVDAADVGAGTGKLSRLLADAGLRVHAVDPSADMLAQIDDPRISCHRGTGEATTLADGSVDLVTFAQSWHWVDEARGAAELRRILRPGGRLGLVWNLLDTSVPWVQDLVGAMHSVHPDGEEGIEGRANEVVDLPGFTHFEHHRLPWQQVLAREDLVALPGTRSYWLRADPERRAAGLARVREVVSRAPGSVDGRVALPYLTQVSVAVVKPGETTGESPEPPR